MKILSFCCLLLTGWWLSTGLLPAKKVKLTVSLQGCAAQDTMFLWRFEGFGFQRVQTGTVGNVGQFEFKFPQSSASFYYLGNQPDNVIPLILGSESEVAVKGLCEDLGKALVGSELNDAYSTLKAELEDLKKRTDQKMREWQLAKRKNDEGGERMAIFELSEIDDQRMELLNKYRDAHPLLRQIVAMNTYLSFQNNEGNYYSEIDYFANEFFQFADLSSPYHAYNPWVYETFKAYAANLAGTGVEKELVQSYLDERLQNLDAASHTYQLALSGVVAGLDAQKNKNYTLYGRQLVKKYEGQHANIIAPLKTRIEGAGGFESGAVAPDFTQQTPDGEDLKLSDLRGKVVLVDFWASWCGPCRRENPHVKELYDKYSHRGFEILGVSLDRTKASWERAIAQDQLDWHHVSDLKGWKNEVAKMYSVRSIPHTILLDREGRIIARKLRAAQLEEVLEQIFGD